MTRAELRWAVTWGLVVMLITCAPYLYVATLAPPGTCFSGLLFEADDHCVYLAWEQQAAYYLDRHDRVDAFVKNQGLNFAIPYLHNGQGHEYLPEMKTEMIAWFERHLPVK